MLKEVNTKGAPSTSTNGAWLRHMVIIRPGMGREGRCSWSENKRSCWDKGWQILNRTSASRHFPYVQNGKLHIPVPRGRRKAMRCYSRLICRAEVFEIGVCTGWFCSGAGVYSRNANCIDEKRRHQNPVQLILRMVEFRSGKYVKNWFGPIKKEENGILGFLTIGNGSMYWKTKIRVWYSSVHWMHCLIGTS